MGIRIDTGKKEELRFKNRKIAIDSGGKTVHTGNIGVGTPLRDVQSNTRNTSNIQNNIGSQTRASKKRKHNNLIDRSDSIAMKRGQKISLTQKASNLSKLLVGLEWETEQNLNLDVSVFMVDGDNRTKEENFIFYNNPKSTDSSVLLDEDHGIGVKDCYDAMLRIDLSSVLSNIQKLAVTITIDEEDGRNLNFGNLSREAYFKVIDASKKKEILSYRFNEQLSRETAIVVAEIYRYKDEWKINTIGSGFIGGLKALCDNYGIETV